MHQDSVFMSSLTPYNHQSLQAEHCIKSLSTRLTPYLTGSAQTWPKYLPLAILAYNTFKCLNLANYNLYKLVLVGNQNTFRLRNKSRC